MQDTRDARAVRRRVGEQLADERREERQPLRKRGRHAPEAQLAEGLGTLHG
jgi:hypothetical protein